MNDGTVRMSHKPSPQWSHAEKLTRLLESAVMNTELRIYKQLSADADQDVDDLVAAIDHLWYRNQAMEELNRIFVLYDRLQLILERPNLFIGDELHRQMIAVTLARIDERLQAPSHRS